MRSGGFKPDIKPKMMYQKIWIIRKIGFNGELMLLS